MMNPYTSIKKCSECLMFSSIQFTDEAHIDHDKLWTNTFLILVLFVFC